MVAVNRNGSDMNVVAIEGARGGTLVTLLQNLEISPSYDYRCGSARKNDIYSFKTYLDVAIKCYYRKEISAYQIRKSHG